MKKAIFILLTISVISCKIKPSMKTVHHSSNEDLKELSYIKQGLNNLPLNLQIIGDTAFYSTNLRVVEKIFLHPLKIENISEEKTISIQDQAIMVANCLLVLRNVKTAGEYCHIPEIESVEVYTGVGYRTKYLQSDAESNSLKGFHFTSNFNGNSFTSPSGEWGIIAIEAENMLYGYMHITYQGMINELPFNDIQFIGEDYNKSYFNDKNQFVFKLQNEEGLGKELIINSDGTNTIEK